MSFAFPVEAGHILTFSRAIGESDPVYLDAEVARASGFDDVLAPPTFVEASAHFDPDSEVRPIPGEPWLGSGREPTGLPPDRRVEGTRFHAETHLEFHRHFTAGELLRVQRRDGDQWTKQGSRGGALNFHDWFLDAYDAQDRLVTVSRTVAVETSQRVPPSAPPGSADPAVLERLLEATRDRRPGNPLATGDRLCGLVVDDLTRTQIVQYAGASGDFSPQHTDEFHNIHHAGYPTVFAHGMLGMGFTARALTRWFGPATLARLWVRFVDQVWPGDSLVVRAVVERCEDRDGTTAIDCSVETLNQHGSAVLVGGASVVEQALG